MEFDDEDDDGVIEQTRALRKLKEIGSVTEDSAQFFSSLLTATPIYGNDDANDDSGSLQDDTKRMFCPKINDIVKTLRSSIRSTTSDRSHDARLRDLLLKLPHDKDILAVDVVLEIHVRFLLMMEILEDALNNYVRIETSTLDALYDELGLYACTYSTVIQHAPRDFFHDGIRQRISLEIDIARILMYATYVVTLNSFCEEEYASNIQLTYLENIGIGDFEFVTHNKEYLHNIIEMQEGKRFLCTMDMKNYMKILVILENTWKRLVWNDDVIMFIQVLFLRAGRLVYVPNTFCNIERYSTVVDEEHKEYSLANDNFINAAGRKLVYFLRGTVYMRHLERITLETLVYGLKTQKGGKLQSIIPALFMKEDSCDLLKVEHKIDMWLMDQAKTMKHTDKLRRKMLDRHTYQILLEEEERQFRDKEPCDYFYDQYTVFEQLRDQQYRARLMEQHDGSLVDIMKHVDDITVVEYGKYLVFAEYIKMTTALHWNLFSTKNPFDLLHRRLQGISNPNPMFVTLFNYPTLVLNTALLPDVICGDGDGGGMETKIVCIDCGRSFSRVLIAWLILIRHCINKMTDKTLHGFKLHTLDDLVDHMISVTDSSSSTTVAPQAGAEDFYTIYSDNDEKEKEIESDNCFFPPSPRRTNGSRDIDVAVPDSEIDHDEYENMSTTAAPKQNHTVVGTSVEE